MTPLLTIVAAACVLALTVHFGRGFWTRAKTMERHQQALDTLAGLTRRSEKPAPQAGDPEHQAHVRVVGQRAGSGPGQVPDLPPPRSLARLGPGRPSPFRRLSQMAPSAAAMETAAMKDNPDPEATTRLVQTTPPPPVRRPTGEHAGRADEKPITNPLPVVQPQVFYFDDFVPPLEPGGQPRVVRRRRRQHRQASRHASPAGAAPTGASPAAGGAAGTVRSREATLARALAAAAVIVALGAIGLTIAETWPRGPARPLHLGAPRHATVTTSPGIAATTLPAPATTVPSQPALLVSAGDGTATYQLSSQSASIIVTAIGRCWIEAKVGSPGGRVVYEQTLVAGERVSITGPAWLRLGNPPAVNVAVDGTLLQVPGESKAVPLNLQFTLG